MSDRTSIVDGPLGTEIIVRPAKILGLRLFMPVWLLGWTLGEVAALVTVASVLVGGAQPFAGPLPFLAIWLMGWTIAGAFA